MSKLTDSSAIKLFGKTIPLPTLNQEEALADHDSYSTTTTTKEDQDSKEKQLILKDNKEQDSSSNDPNSGSQQKALKKPDKILPCPRCNSKETKFCYYNNYNVNQPRHFCKNCQRYWTAGGTMRNVPVGAGRRKTKASSALHYHHIMISEAIRAAQATAANGLMHHHHNNNNNGHVLTFGSNASVFNPFPNSLSRPASWPYPRPALCPQGYPSSNSASPTVGKHCRDHHDEYHNNILSSSELGRKTLRIDDANETAKSSMIAKLVMHSGGLFDGFESKSSSGERNYRSLQAFSVLQANPAALSRSLNLHENT